MYKSQPPQSLGVTHTLKKFLLSGFVVFTFVAYAIHERSTSPIDMSVGTPITDTIAPAQPVTSISPSSNQEKLSTAPVENASRPPAIVPSPIPPTPTSSGMYVDGNYVGSVADAYYGNVQVEAVIQGGKVTDVQFLDYPRDRRTSLRISTIAGPYLTQEAIQAQSASVNIISGATLTSQAFRESLQFALNQARN